MPAQLYSPSNINRGYPLMSTDSEVPNNNATMQLLQLALMGLTHPCSDGTYQVGANSPPEVQKELERPTRVFHFNK
ncbi:hypothetical protein BYT27DRAFT_6659708 [Phlegmacium glaucopus]|nr:hypothetical protein BYT27DRAFT_6659708 [Phlegmacium glaucopus]